MKEVMVMNLQGCVMTENCAKEMYGATIANRCLVVVEYDKEQELYVAVREY